jgi:hypothetical protein
MIYLLIYDIDKGEVSKVDADSTTLPNYNSKPNIKPNKNPNSDPSVKLNKSETIALIEIAPIIPEIKSKVEFRLKLEQKHPVPIIIHFFCHIEVSFNSSCFPAILSCFPPHFYYCSPCPPFLLFLYSLSMMPSSMQYSL